MCGAWGITNITLIFSLVKAILTIMISAHVLCCLWYSLGASRIEAGEHSWLDSENMVNAGLGEQYAYAFHWVLGQFTPAPSRTVPGNFLERLFNIFTIIFSLLVMGNAVSRVTQTMQQLNAMNAENSKKRLHIRQYMSANSIPLELSSRIMRFVDFALSNQRKANLDTTLLSDALQKELTMVQRSGHLISHPLLEQLSESFRGVFLRSLRCDQACGIREGRDRIFKWIMGPRFGDDGLWHLCTHKGVEES
jgi:hypothetical protein